MTHRYSLLHKPSRNIEDDQDLQQIHKQHQRNFKDLQGVSELLFMASVPCTILDFIFSTHVVGIVWKWGKRESSFELNLSCPELEQNRTWTLWQWLSFSRAHFYFTFPNLSSYVFSCKVKRLTWQKLSYNNGEPHNQKYAHGWPISLHYTCHLLFWTFVA